MRMHEMLVAAVVLWLIILMSDHAWGHETHGFKHLRYGLDPITYSGSCEIGLYFWAIDSDGDLETDQCVLWFMAHGDIHVRPFPTSMIDHPYGLDERVVGCNCDDMNKQLGDG